MYRFQRLVKKVSFKLFSHLIGTWIREETEAKKKARLFFSKYFIESIIENLKLANYYKTK